MENKPKKHINYVNSNAKRRRLLVSYGKLHLCGECKHTFTCERMIIQNGRDLERKAKLMKKYAPFATIFEIEPFCKANRNYGFIKVYECSRFEFDDI